MKWICEIPGPKNTIWEAGTYTLIMEFPNDYYYEQQKIYIRLSQLIEFKTIDANSKPETVFMNIKRFL